mmetsp:Transcript_15426/g.29347  ORF Transcript_15426/g.29347 Transcript_15426/m.29347 type:complete len:251 (-) Transcript_15426:476-1228(-)
MPLFLLLRLLRRLSLRAFSSRHSLRGLMHRPMVSHQVFSPLHCSVSPVTLLLSSLLDTRRGTIMFLGSTAAIGPMSMPPPPGPRPLPNPGKSVHCMLRSPPLQESSMPKLSSQILQLQLLPPRVASQLDSKFVPESSAPDKEFMSRPMQNLKPCSCSSATSSAYVKHMLNDMPSAAAPSSKLDPSPPSPKPRRSPSTSPRGGIRISISTSLAPKSASNPSTSPSIIMVMVIIPSSSVEQLRSKLSPGSSS